MYALTQAKRKEKVTRNNIHFHSTYEKKNRKKAILLMTNTRNISRAEIDQEMNIEKDGK